MILDEYGEFADAFDVTLASGGTVATHLWGDVIDLGAASPGPGVGVGEPMYLVITVDTAFLATAGAATVQFILASDAQAAIATDGSASVHFQTAAISKATLLNNYVVAAVALPLGTPVYERYLGILGVVATNPITTGKFNAFLTHDVQRWRAYAAAI